MTFKFGLMLKGISIIHLGGFTLIVSSWSGIRVCNMCTKRRGLCVAYGARKQSWSLRMAAGETECTRWFWRPPLVCVRVGITGKVISRAHVLVIIFSQSQRPLRSRSTTFLSQISRAFQNHLLSRGTTARTYLPTYRRTNLGFRNSPAPNRFHP